MVASTKPPFVGMQRVISPHELDDFVRRAQLGERLVYCAAPELIRGETATRVLELEQAGMITPHHHRREGGGWEWFVQRTGRKIGSGLAKDETRQSDGRATDVILRALKRAANMAQPCPTQRELVRLLESEQLELTTDQVKFRIRKLVDAGVIRSMVVHENGEQVRVVTIVATGKRTALPPKWAAAQRAAAMDAGQSHGATR